MRRVVVTGLGLVTPLAANVSASWDRLVAGKSGIKSITKFDVSDLQSKIAGIVPSIEEDEQGLDSLKIMSKKEQRRVDDFILYGLAAIDEALKDANWLPQTEEEKERTGITVGSGIGGLPYIQDNSIIMHDSSPKRISPFFIPGSLINLVSGNASIKYGFKGPNHSVVTACSTGAHSIGDASRFIQFGDADVMIAGGAEAAICRVGVAGFSAVKALSTSYNDTPEKASRPWDKGRDGFVMGEGAGIMVLEEYEHAKKRGAKIYAEIVGYGLSGDAYHITSPEPTGQGGYSAMKRALSHANLDVTDVDYINAHGTSTPMGDVIELKAVKRLLGDHVKNIAMSSTKSSIGHLLGAAGGVEAVFSVLALNNNIAPPTLNLENVEEGCEDVNLVPNQSQDKNMNVVISNSFGFGGTNASLIFKKL